MVLDGQNDDESEQRMATKWWIKRRIMIVNHMECIRPRSEYLKCVSGFRSTLHLCNLWTSAGSGWGRRLTALGQDEVILIFCDCVFGRIFHCFSPASEDTKRLQLMADPSTASTGNSVFFMRMIRGWKRLSPERYFLVALNECDSSFSEECIKSLFSERILFCSSYSFGRLRNRIYK